MPRSQFTTELPSLQYAWDNSSLEPFKACRRKYYYNMILMRVPSNTAPPLVWGGLYASAQEKFDKGYAEHGDFDRAQRDAVRWALQESGKREPGFTCDDPECGTWQSGTIADYEGVPPNCPSCSEPMLSTSHWVPWTSDDNRRSRFTLVRSIVWYTEQFHPEQDPLETLILPDGSPAIELSFQISLGITTPFGQDYLWCGHMDKMARLPEGGVYVQERKHTVTTLNPNYFDRFSPNGQISGYNFAGEVLFGETPKGVIVDATQVAVGFTRFLRGYAHRTKSQIKEWLHSTLYHIRLAEECAKHDDWPMNDASCFMYGGCPYREICNKDESVRDRFLESNFKERDWNPLEVRE